MPNLMMLSDAVTPVTPDQFQSVLTTLQSQISVSTIVGVLGIAAGAAVGLVFMWWGVRKLTKVLMKAFTKARLGL